MKKRIKSFLSACILIMFFSNLSHAQNSNRQQSDSISFSQDEVDKQDSLMPQTVTISDTTSIQGTENNSRDYLSTEKIHIYSGKHDGNNVIKSVEVPIPENKSSYNGVYIPH